MVNEDTLIAAQRAWVRKRFGEELAATLRVLTNGPRYVESEIDSGGGHVHSSDYGKARHSLDVGRLVHGEWVYPDWVPMPPPLARLAKPGALVLKATGQRHLFCQCRVESSRAKIAGRTPRRFAQYQLRCVDEQCTNPEKYFSFADSMGAKSRLIELPITPKAITTERNTEVRRRLVDLYGADNYLRDANAELVAQDDWGKLWRLDQPNDEPLVMVEMVNSTPEPDGSYSTYWERVPPGMRTPLEALAWQADVTPAAYARMEVQT